MAIQVTANTNTEEMQDILAHKAILENNKNNIQHLMENHNSHKIEQNYIREADKGTAYHFSKKNEHQNQSDKNRAR